MLNSIFNGLFDTAVTSVISASDFILCMVVSLALGLVFAFAYMFRTTYTKSFVITLAMLPAVVCIVIMMVNGNIGAGVAVAGAFSLVRFRSVAGTAKEIGAIFIAMGTGLIAGMGYLAYAALFTIIMAVIIVIYNVSNLGKTKKSPLEKELLITIPEDLDYTGIFDDLFSEYTSEHELIKAKTSNMGSLFRLKYNITLKDSSKEKEFIDQLRCRNGNLEISISVKDTVTAEL